jgi:DNA adenine methylase
MNSKAVPHEIINYARPVLKWPGGKRQLEDTILAAIDRLHPEQIEKYYEPFVGGGAIFFALAARRRFRYARLSDTNAELIGTYVAIRDDVKSVIRELNKLIKKPYGEKTYYLIRAAKPRSPCARAARMIYLNKTCYNGLYRVNKSGGFNVPWGKRKNPQILDLEALHAASAALIGVELSVDSFQNVADAADPEDFIFFDPPYVPLNAQSFTAYQADGFKGTDHLILAEHLKILAGKGVPALLSNSHCPVTVKLYKGLVKTRVLARRSINRNGAERGHVSELLVEARFTSQSKKKKESHASV